MKRIKRIGLLRAALKQEIDNAELDMEIEADEINSSTSTLDVLTVVLSLWAIVITVGVVAIMSLVFRRVCCKTSPSSAASTASDAEFGNDDDDGVSERSSVVDFRLDPSQLEDYSKQSKRKVEGWHNSAFDSSDVINCYSGSIKASDSRACENNVDLAVHVGMTSQASDGSSRSRDDTTTRSLRAQAKSLMSFLVPGKR